MPAQDTSYPFLDLSFRRSQIFHHNHVFRFISRYHSHHPNLFSGSFDTPQPPGASIEMIQVFMARIILIFEFFVVKFNFLKILIAGQFYFKELSRVQVLIKQ